MKAWQPRQPSPALRARIFATETQPVEFCRAPLDWADFTRWLVPALGCFVVFAGMALDPSMQATGAFATPSTHQVAYSIEAERTGWGGAKNTVPAKNLEWTVAQPSRSSSDSFVGSDTNSLRK
ncbi:MAG TPA: hypothetical protein VM680_03630 [Verrucomicrobiae bacterium]|nr:hypothetical protein [Verrucomicrobiae bacterium]